MIMARKQGTDTIAEVDTEQGPEWTDAEQEQEFGGFVVETSPGIERAARAEKPNPLESAVVQSLQNDMALQVAVKDADQAKAVTNLLRRAQAKLDKAAADEYQSGVRMNVQHRDGAVHFHAKYGTVNRKYTAADIRTWWDEQPHADGDWDGKGKIPTDVREAYKVAFGFAKAKDNGGENGDVE